MSEPKPLSVDRLRQIQDFMDHPEGVACLQSELFYGRSGPQLLTTIRDLLAAESYWRLAVKDALVLEVDDDVAPCPFCEQYSHQTTCPWVLAQE